MSGYTNDVLAYLASGGVVIWPLLALGAVLWFLVGLRLLGLRSGDHWRAAGQKVILEDTATRNPIVVCRAVETELGRFAGGIRAIVAVAPLLGLLGTVHGMVETFDALTVGALFAASGGVAGGISEALVTTQLGLFIAIPGLFVGRVLDRHEARLRRSVERLRDRLEREAA